MQCNADSADSIRTGPDLSNRHECEDSRLGAFEVLFLTTTPLTKGYSRDKLQGRRQRNRSTLYVIRPVNMRARLYGYERKSDTASSAKESCLCPCEAL